MIRAALSKRSAFTKWANNVKKISVVDFNENGFGHLNLDAWR